MRRFWTQTEDEYLRQNYHTRNSKEIAKTLDRTTKSVTMRAIKIGLSTPTDYWSQQEERLLLSWNRNLSELAKKLGRSRESVRQKARRMGIEKQFPNKQYPDFSHVQLRPEVAAYVAGLVDGEGHVRIQVTKGKTRWRFSTSLGIRIIADDIEALHFCHDSTKLGSVGFQKQGNGKPLMAHWRTYGSAALQLAQQILPYSRIKTRRLELLVSFLESRRSHSPNLLLRNELEQVIEITELNAQRMSSFEKLKQLQDYLREVFPPGVDELRIPTHPM